MRIAIVVGTILTFIDHGDLIISGALTPECLLKMALICLVPYCVASWTNIKAEMEVL